MIRAVLIVRTFRRKAHWAAIQQDYVNKLWTPSLGGRVARWLTFMTIISIWAYFGGPWNRKWYFIDIWYILRPAGIGWGHLVYFGMLCQANSGNPARGSRQKNDRRSESLSRVTNRTDSEALSTFFSPAFFDIFAKTIIFVSYPGLPDFSRYNIPKRVQIYQMTTKCTKWP
jgi:hypothetical protein